MTHIDAPRATPWLCHLAAALLASGAVLAQTPPAAEPATAPSAAAPPPAGATDAVLPTVRATARPEESGKETLTVERTRIGKGNQELRDVPQSLTVITEKLLDDRNQETLKESLKNAGGVTFLAAEGGEEDIRLRGFSLQGSGDIFIDGMRDPAFYDRDAFNWDRLEVLRGSASMLFGRGSTGGAVNQVSKQPFLRSQSDVTLTGGSGESVRTVGDVNIMTGDRAALRANAMYHHAGNYGAGIDKYGFAPTFRWGIGARDEFTLGFYRLENDNGINYGLPWLAPGATRGGDYLWPTAPQNYYGLASDYLDGGTTQGNALHVHRFGRSAELRTALRVANYQRDQRASAIRFAPAALQPGGLAVTADTFGDATVLRRSNGNGVQLKTMNMDTVYAQSDYSGRHRWFGLLNAVQAGVDFAHEDFENFGLDPASPPLAKPDTTVGTPDDGARVDERARVLLRNRTFTARAWGLYAQDLLSLNEHWKLLAGLRWDRMDGEYHNIAINANPNNPCSVTPATRIGRRDSLLSKRFGALYQPSATTSLHLSYGTSFNTSGDTYQYDAGTVNVEPESSRNIELGAKFDSASGRYAARVALFHSTKYNERNRDADTVDACNYVLSGERHVAGLDFDVAGRLTPRWELYFSYAYMPEAEVDASSGAPGTEAVGSRPGLTPRHSGTLWSTYKLGRQWRVGGGLNARSRDKPVGLAPSSGVRAPAFVTGDLMIEYGRGPLALRANLTNLTDEHYAEMLYRGHYIPGQPRTLEVTASWRF
ncbi:MAG: TonB-dependent receptor [Gammaproteobacteria bacterium]|nr:TonB-dependent receptor [Gammaproteobacteria bacterium]